MRRSRSNSSALAGRRRMIMDVEQSLQLKLTRRHLFGLSAKGIGIAALASLIAPKNLLGEVAKVSSTSNGLPGLPHFPPKAKRVIFLFQSGAPSQVELFDYKPKLRDLHGTQLPNSARQGPPLAGMAVSDNGSFTLAAPSCAFHPAGKSGTWISELLPHTSKIVDDIALIKSVQSDAA